MAGYLQDSINSQSAVKPVTVPWIVQSPGKNRKIVAVTAYDAPSAAIADSAGVDLVLVGDSLGTVVQGHPDTLSVTLDEMIYHTKCVRRGLQRALLVVDLPFGTFQAGPEATLSAAVRVLKESGAAAVKIEGGERVLDSIKACTCQDIPVMGHLGLTPQSVHAFGGYRIQGKTDQAAQKMIDDARLLQDAGVFSIVLECIPADLANRITDAVDVPTIGIGAGVGCDGQVLVFHDVLGLLPQTPGFVKRFAELGDAAVQGLKAYGDAVREQSFPESTS